MTKPRKQLSDDGVELGDGSLAKWPDSCKDGFPIVVVNEHGDRIETVFMPETQVASDIEDARWLELRDMMPDDVLYFQPAGAGDPDNTTSASKIKSYHVFRNRWAAVEAHSDVKEIHAFHLDDVQEPKFLDVENPWLFCESEDDNESQVAKLVVAWDESGRKATIHELCKDRPDLAEDVGYMIRVLLRLKELKL